MHDLAELFEPVVTSMGYELVGVEFADNEGRKVLRVYIDHENGITLDDCTEVSHQLSAVLDVEDPVPGVYDLEISSPGLERPLFKLADFERYAGHGVQIKMAVPQLGRRNFSGRLNGVTEDENIDITVDNETYELPFRDIKKAHLLIEF